MSPRYVSALIAMVVAIGGAVAIANPSSFGLRPIAQAPIATPSALSPSPSFPNPLSPSEKEPGWLKDLNLSADQVKQMRAVRSQYKDKIIQGRQSVHQSQQELRDLMASDASESQIRTKYDQVRTARQQVADTHANLGDQEHQHDAPQPRQIRLSQQT